MAYSDLMSWGYNPISSSYGSAGSSVPRSSGGIGSAGGSRSSRSSYGSAGSSVPRSSGGIGSAGGSGSWGYSPTYSSYGSAGSSVPRSSGGIGSAGGSRSSRKYRGELGKELEQAISAVAKSILGKSADWSPKRSADKAQLNAVISAIESIINDVALPPEGKLVRQTYKADSTYRVPYADMPSASPYTVTRTASGDYILHGIGQNPYQPVYGERLVGYAPDGGAILDRTNVASRRQGGAVPVSPYTAMRMYGDQAGRATSRFPGLELKAPSYADSSPSLARAYDLERQQAALAQGGSYVNPSEATRFSSGTKSKLIRVYAKPEEVLARAQLETAIRKMAESLTAQPAQQLFTPQDQPAQQLFTPQDSSQLFADLDSAYPELANNSSNTSSALGGAPVNVSGRFYPSVSTPPSQPQTQQGNTLFNANPTPASTTVTQQRKPLESFLSRFGLMTAIIR